MKYFTEYIQTEGPIVEGDMIAFEGNMNDILMFGKEVIPPAKWSDKKVKLVLCTRDIQVGDKIQYLSRDGEMWFEGILDKIEGEYIFLKEDRFMDDYHMSYLLKDAYKVIGKVSSQAVWVTKGMEFDTSELAYVMGEPKYPYYFEFSDIKCWDIEGMKKFPIAIKSSQCKHFH